VRGEHPHVRLDLPTIVVVAAAGLLLVASLTVVRFCGSVDMPKPPPKPSFTRSAEEVSRDLVNDSSLYAQRLVDDAKLAGVSAPTLDEMSKRLGFRDPHTTRTPLALDRPVELAGLRLTASARKVRGDQQLVLVIENPSTSHVAYRIDTAISGGSAACQNRDTIPFNGTVIAPGGTETRSECRYRKGMELYVERVESAEVLPLQAYYLSLVPPRLLGQDERVSDGHEPTLPAGVAPCHKVSLPQAIKTAMSDGRTRWRDLVDFYARHPCTDSRYQFPEGYRAFESDGERSLP
jgi:hypothetical protein